MDEVVKLTDAELADRLLIFGTGGRQYQVRINMKRGAIVLCGASGGRRDWVREDIAALFGQPPSRVQVTKVRRPDMRRPRIPR